MATKCHCTGYACVHDEGHAGPHRARDGREWGGEKCDHRHIFRPWTTKCFCGKTRRSKAEAKAKGVTS